MNDFSNEQIKKLSPEIIALGRRKLETIDEKFEQLWPDIEDAIAFEYLLYKNDIVERFGILKTLDELIEQLQEYAGIAEFDLEETGRIYLLQKVFSALSQEVQK